MLPLADSGAAPPKRPGPIHAVPPWRGPILIAILTMTALAATVTSSGGKLLQNIMMMNQILFTFTFPR